MSLFEQLIEENPYKDYGFPDRKSYEDYEAGVL